MKAAYPTPSMTLEHVWILQKNFGKPVEWGLVKDYAWSTPQLRKLDVPVSCHSVFACASLAEMQ